MFPFGHCPNYLSPSLIRAMPERKHFKFKHNHHIVIVLSQTSRPLPRSLVCWKRWSIPIEGFWPHFSWNNCWRLFQRNVGFFKALKLDHKTIQSMNFWQLCDLEKEDGGWIPNKILRRSFLSSHIFFLLKYQI